MTAKGQRAKESQTKDRKEEPKARANQVKPETTRRSSRAGICSKVNALEVRIAVSLMTGRS